MIEINIEFFSRAHHFYDYFGGRSCIIKNQHHQNSMFLISTIIVTTSYRYEFQGSSCWDGWKILLFQGNVFNKNLLLYYRSSTRRSAHPESEIGGGGGIRNLGLPEPQNF